MTAPARSARTSQQGLTAEELNRQGLVLYYSAKYGDAAAAFQRAIVLKADYAEAYFNLGNAFFLLKQYQFAIEAFQKAIRYQPGLVSAYNNLGTAYVKTGARDQAIAAYREAIRIDPKASDSLYNLGAMYLETRNREAALAQYELLKTIDPAAANKLYLLLNPPAARVFDGKLVRLNVTVTDSARALVRDIKPGDLRLLENGVPQDITFFSPDAAPIAYGLVVDNSGSNRPNLLQAIKLAQTVIKSANAADEGFVVSFNSADNIRVLQEFTADRNLLEQAVDGVFIEPGQTALIDAVLQAASQLGRYRAEETAYRRRVLILFSDGEDRNSFHMLEGLLSVLRALDVQVFTIGLQNEGQRDGSPGWERSRSLMTRIAAETGGRAIYIKKAAELQSAAAGILEQVHAQYTIGYLPTNPVTSNSVHNVTVSAADSPEAAKRTATTRTGYAITAVP